MPYVSSRRNSKGPINRIEYIIGTLYLYVYCISVYYGYPKAVELHSTDPQSATFSHYIAMHLAYGARV